MTNNERFNAKLNGCKNKRKIFDLLQSAAQSTDIPRDSEDRNKLIADVLEMMNLLSAEEKEQILSKYFAKYKEVM